MDFWRDLIVVAFLSCLLWYWSDLGQVLIHVGTFLLCYFFMVPAVRYSSESSSQTENTAEHYQASEAGHMVGRDETDTAEQTTLNRSQYPNVQRSLHQLFKSVYTRMVLPWVLAPELGDSHPLYAALLRDFNCIMDQIICKAENFDLTITSVHCIEIFTRHLHCAKQSDKYVVFECKAEEMAALRAFSDALMRNLVPEYLWKPNVYHAAFQEILATKVLALVTLLSDPDNLNRLVVSQLDRVSSESLAEAHDSDAEDTTSCWWGESTERLKEEAEEGPFEENKAKKKGTRLKEKFAKVMDNIHPKRAKNRRRKKEEEELRQRALSSRRPAVIQTDCAHSGEDSSCDSDNLTLEDSDVESCTSSLHEEMMEFKLSFGMWLAGKWTVTVTKGEIEDEGLCFTVHLEENNTESLHWDVIKSQQNIEDFCKCCKDVSHLPSISMILENTETELSDDYLDKAKEAFEHFLQALLSDKELGQTQLVFKFLCPLNKLLRAEEHNGGVWVLLGGLASFLTPGQEDDELSSLKGEEKPDEAADVCSLSESTPHHEDTPPLQTDCTSMSQRRCSSMEGDLWVTDSGCSAPCDQTTDFTHEKHPEHTDGLHQVNSDLVRFKARTKVIPKRQPASIKSLDSDSESMNTTDGCADHHFNGGVHKKEHARKKSSSSDKFKGRERREEPQSQPPKKMANSHNSAQPEITKAIFDLLKEISGNSRIFKIIKTALTPFMSLVKKKVNVFLKKLNPSEAQMANNIDSLRELIWPESAGPEGPARSSEDKNETREKAMHLVSSKLAGCIIISKTDVETMFKVLQDSEENKNLVYMLLSCLLKEFLPGETVFNLNYRLRGKDTI